MKHSLNILLVTFLLLSCSKKDNVICDPFTEMECINMFMEINDLKIVDANNGDCKFYSIYLFEGNYYFEYNCCVCDLIGSIINCSNELYALGGEEKYNNFKEKAILQDRILIEK